MNVSTRGEVFHKMGGHTNVEKIIRSKEMMRKKGVGWGRGELLDRLEVDEGVEGDEGKEIVGATLLGLEVVVVVVVEVVEGGEACFVGATIGVGADAELEVALSLIVTLNFMPPWQCTTTPHMKL